MFENRLAAGKRLGEALTTGAIDEGRAVGIDVVLAIPRGALPVARPVADALGVGLDVVVASKIGAPENPELALGAAAADGTVWLNDELIERLGVDAEYLDRERDREATAAAEKRARYRSEPGEVETPTSNANTDPNSGAEPDFEGASVLVVDDGLATGATAVACLRQVRAAGAAWVGFAAPVGSRNAVARVEREADEVICLDVPERFGAVGQFYRSFGQVPDEEALQYLDRGSDSNTDPDSGANAGPGS